MSNKQYFLIYANYFIADNKEKHINYFNRHSVRVFWITYEMDSLRQKFILNSNRIEKNRHLLFQNVLTQIAKGVSLIKIEELGSIEKESNRNKPTIAHEINKDKKGKEKISQTETFVSIEFKTEGERLYNLACHSLISFLSVKDNLQKIKRCPYCELFFIAKDTKRKICYDAICKNKYHKKDMQLRREKDPVKYC